MKDNFNNFIDLASGKIGGKVLYATDEFFAEKENLIKPGRGVFLPDRYTDRGKWMDGWETRRRRTPGHDWCIVRLGAPGMIRGLDIDTHHFIGNHPPFAAVEGLYSDSEPADWCDADNLPWQTILKKSPLQPGSQNLFAVRNASVFSHLRLHIFPDGGVARFRAYGEVHRDWSKISENDLLDLAMVTNGGRALICNDMFFSAMENLILPAPAQNMGDGWETKRSRNPDNVDWVILRLGYPGMVQKIIVDTRHFKGNYPAACAIDACYSASDENVIKDAVEWTCLLNRQKLEADREHIFESDAINAHGPVSHVKLKIYPDGGISRLRIFGCIRH